VEPKYKGSSGPTGSLVLNIFFSSSVSPIIACHLLLGFPPGLGTLEGWKSEILSIFSYNTLKNYIVILIFGLIIIRPT